MGKCLIYLIKSDFLSNIPSFPKETLQQVIHVGGNNERKLPNIPQSIVNEWRCLLKACEEFLFEIKDTVDAFLSGTKTTQ